MAIAHPSESSILWTLRMKRSLVILFIVAFMANLSQARLLTSTDLWNHQSGSVKAGKNRSVPWVSRKKIQENSLVKAILHYFFVDFHWEQPKKPTFVPLLKDKLRFKKKPERLLSSQKSNIVQLEIELVHCKPVTNWYQ